MLTFTRIYLRVFCYPTEDLDRVKDALMFVAYGDAFPQKGLCPKTKMSGSGEHHLTILELTIDNKAVIEDFGTRLLESSSLDELEKHIDDQYSLYLRFSKQDAYQKRMIVVDKGDTISCKAKMSPFHHKNMERARHI